MTIYNFQSIHAYDGNTNTRLLVIAGPDDTATCCFTRADEEAPNCWAWVPTSVDVHALLGWLGAIARYEKAWTEEGEIPSFPTPFRAMGTREPSYLIEIQERGSEPQGAGYEFRFSSAEIGEQSSDPRFFVSAHNMGRLVGMLREVWNI